MNDRPQTEEECRFTHSRLDALLFEIRETVHSIDKRLALIEYKSSLWGAFGAIVIIALTKIFKL